MVENRWVRRVAAEPGGRRRDPDVGAPLRRPGLARPFVRAVSKIEDPITKRLRDTNRELGLSAKYECATAQEELVGLLAEVGVPRRAH